MRGVEGLVAVDAMKHGNTDAPVDGKEKAKVHAGGQCLGGLG